VTDRATTSLFEEAYWLDAVAPGRWSAVEVVRDGVLIGRLPYAIVRRYGQSAIAKPWYTTWLGPWVRPSGGKPTTELSHQHQILGELIAGLPKTITSTISCAPEQTNMMAFHWAGWRLGMAYTHRLPTGDEAALWDGLRDTVRRQIRKAEKQTSICSHRTVGEFITILDKTFGRQNLDVSKSYPVLEAIDAVMGPRNQRRIWTAEDAQGRIHAAVYIVFDDRHAIYIAGGSDPEFRQSGAHSSVMWHAIKDAANHAPIFDFAGSMVPGIEYFVRGFGATQAPRYSAERHAGVGKLIDIMRAVRA
jgi:Acetyltransferase (GNAT) domain